MTDIVTWADPGTTWADPVGAWAYPGVTSLTAKFEWSPTTAPGVTPVWVDITERVRSGSIRRGRQSEFDRTSAGKLMMEVDNRDRTFDPSVSSGARPNRRVRVSVGSAPDTQVVFDGFLDGLPQSYDPPNDATVQITATDAFKLLARFELDAIYGPIVEADAPYGWWRLADDLPRTTVVADSSGNDYHGTWKGTPRSGQSLVTDGPGSVSLKGSGDSIEGSADGAVVTAVGSTVAAAPVSVECWVQTGKYGTNTSFICGQTHVTSGVFLTDFGLWMDNSTGFPRFLAMVGGNNITVTAPTVLRDTGVHHLAGTIDGSRVCRLYVDGVLQSSGTPGGSGTTLDASGSFRIGKPPVGPESGTNAAFKAWDGDICEVAVYSRVLSAGEVLEHYTAGAAPWANDTTGTRVGRILDFVGWPAGDRSIDSGASTLGAAQNIEGKTALDHLLAVEQTEQGRFFITGDGDAAFYSRNHETAEVAAVASFTEADYTDLMFDYSEANMVNDMTVTRESGLPQRAQDAVAQTAYWRLSESMTGLLYSTDNEAKAMAEWRVANLANPTLRPSQLTFEPKADLPSLFPRVLVRELGDRITVTRQLDGTDIEVDAVIEGIEHRFPSPREWTVSWNLSPLQYGQFGPGGGSARKYWKLSGPGSSAETRELSKLDEQNRLGF